VFLASAADVYDLWRRCHRINSARYNIFGTAYETLWTWCAECTTVVPHAGSIVKKTIERISLPGRMHDRWSHRSWTASKGFIPFFREDHFLHCR